jgi:hypothetical protein
MATYSDQGSATQTNHERSASRPVRRFPDETKPSFRTTEFYIYLLAVAGVLIASAVVDASEDGQGFGAERAWFFVTLLTIGYLVSRGLAKAGSRSNDSDRRS